MSARARLALFLAAVAMAAPMVLAGLSGLPQFGEHRNDYGEMINAVGVAELHITNLVTAVNFDYRAFDTLGEEYILFAAVIGMLLLLRGNRGQSEGAAPVQTRRQPREPRSEAVTVFGRWICGLILLFGLYTVAHAHLTPGGGFQGGAILGTGILLVYLTDGYKAWRRMAPTGLFDAAEAAGACSYVLIGLAPLLLGYSFLQNVLPLGQAGELLSGGMIPLLNLAVGLEVTAGFVLIFKEFLEETRQRALGERE
jgi:multicomponent Na+:H+ antiporter subunit B